MPRLYIECTYLIDHNDLNTGIQRVVRKIAEHMQTVAPEKNYEPHLVGLRDGYAKEVSLEALYPASGQRGHPDHRSYPARLKAYLKNLYFHTRLWFSALVPWEPFQRFVMAPKESFGLNMLIYRLLYRPVFALLEKTRIRSLYRDPFSLPVEAGDILLILDSSWYMNIWESVDAFKSRGGHVQMVVYDLIPIAYPQFCDDILAEVFKEWIDESHKRVDGYIAISKTVAKDLKTYQTDRGVNLPDRCYEYFYLGADFASKTKEGDIRKDLKTIFTHPNVYISVSTLEPRKNHAYLLDAFEKLWEKGEKIDLVLIGRRGWKVEKLMERIQNHPMKDKHLFYFDDINDVELDYAYTHAKALLFASVVEGFGLPIIDGLTKGLPVIVSDTPIHREIGGAHVQYFDLQNPETLVRIIENETFKSDKKFEGWMTWRESCEMLMEKIVKLSHECSKRHKND